MKLSENLQRFLARRKTANNADLVAQWSAAMETQVNVVAGEERDGKAWTDRNGIHRWSPIRIPKDADTEPHFDDYRLSWSLDEYVTHIGWSGWDWANRVSKRLGYDFDDLVHEKGLTPEQLAEVRAALEALPYVELRRSTSGRGLHAYVSVADIPTATHNEHATLAAAVLAKMSADTGRDIRADLDCCGRILWIWARDAAPNGFELLKQSTQVLGEADFPGWRATIVPPREKRERPAEQSKADLWDALCDPYYVPKDAEHDRITEELRAGGWPCVWLPERRCFQTHTARLLEVHKALGLRGRFDTLSPGTDKSEANCYIFPRPHGAFLVKRFSNPTETPGWTPDENGHPCRMFNAEAAEPASTEPAKKPSVKLLTCKQLDTEPYSIRYHIAGTLAALQNHIIGGRQKTLKTTIAVDAAISLASGLPFLGTLPVNQTCRVLMLSGESGLSVLQESARRICRSKGVCLPDIDGLFWSEWLPRLDNAKHLEMLKQAIQETGAEVLFLDPCYLAMPGADAGNLFLQGERLRSIAEICQEHAVCPILLHHLRKRAKGDHSFDPPELDELSWSGFSEFARQWWLLGRREPYEGGSGSHKLWLSIGGSAGHSALWAVDVEEGIAGAPRRWEVSLSRPEEARAVKKENTIRQRILDAAREFTGGETKTGILTVAKVKSDPAVRAIFDSLVNEGLLIPCKVKKGAAGYDGFRLPEKGGNSCTA